MRPCFAKSSRPYISGVFYLSIPIQRAGSLPLNAHKATRGKATEATEPLAVLAGFKTASIHLRALQSFGVYGLYDLYGCLCLACAHSIVYCHYAVHTTIGMVQSDFRQFIVDYLIFSNCVYDGTVEAFPIGAHHA